MTVMPQDPTPLPSAASEFVLRLGQALHRYGVPAHRLEEALAALAAHLGLHGEFFAIPTGIMVTIGEEGMRRTELMRSEPGAVDLEKMALVDTLAEQVTRGELTPAEGIAELATIERAPARYGRVLTTLCFGLASAAAARFFGGGGREIAVAGVLGLGVGLLDLLYQRLPQLGRVGDALTALVATLLTFALARPLGPLAVEIVGLAALIVLIPGFTLTIALSELATKNLVAGTARLASALITFLQLGFGAAIAGRLMERLVGAPPPATPHPVPGWTLAVALVLAPLAFIVLLRAARRDIFWILIAGLVAFGGARLGAGWLGPELGVFLGALGLGIYGNLYARRARRPAAVPVVPGLMFLVPGSLGFRSFASLVDRQVDSGIATAFAMSLIAVSLVAGLLFANAIVAPRRAL